MGTWAHVIVVDPPAGALRRARRRVEQLEGRWSRFRPDSEVSRLNRAAGRPVMVSADTAMLVSRALAGRRGTAGRFDPTMLGPLVDAGYDRSFDQLDRDPVPGLRRAGVVALAPRAGFDPGGIGKGLAADLVVDELLEEGAGGACVNLGGDLRAQGCGPWQVDVADPFDARRPPVARLALDAGGVATSSRLGRTWWHAGARQHHLIDPRSGRPADTAAVAVTVLTGEAWRAEVLAKAALLAGVEGALHLLAESQAAGLVIDDAGTIHPAANLDPFVR